MERVSFDGLVTELRTAIEGATEISVFPLDEAVKFIQAQVSARRDILSSSARSVSEDELRVLAFFDVTGVSASLAIRRLSAGDSNTAGITSALVDLWGRAEAGRCLWFDAHSLFSGEEAAQRTLALKESARLLAPEAIAIAFRLSVSVAQYVDFVSKVIA